jgi:hypothetical protein
MPNRYGEHPEPQPDDQPDQPDQPPPATHTTDHKAAAQRGMNQIRTIMGWKHPQNPPQNQPHPKNRTP